MRVLLLALFCVSAHAAERVLEFHSDVGIAPDGTLTVIETITVHAEGKQIRRGLFRDFPTDYRDRHGARVTVPFKVLAVARNGRPEPYALERLGNGTRVRIGSAAVLLAPGRHEYRIVYETARQIGFFERHDELYWNVNGTGWPFLFERVSAQVRFGQAVAPQKLRVEAYTGPQGARGRDYEASVRHGAAAVRTTRPLAPREGLTLVVAFPKGIVAPPGPWQRVRWLLADNRGAVVGSAGLALLLLFLGWRWHLVGRDPRAGPRFPRYEPPPGVGPAGVRYIDRMGFDERCFAAALLGLGSRGYLRIRQIGERYRVERLGKETQWLPGERELAQALLPPGTERLDIERFHDPAIGEARDRLAGALEHHFGRRLFSKNRGSLFAGAAIAFATGAAMHALGAPWLLGGAIAGAMLVSLLLFARWLPAYSVQGRRLQDAIEGLRQYLAVAERDELARMKAPPQTAEEFARFLPYAYALGVERTWADRFAATLGAAAVANAVADYYGSDRVGNVGRLSDSLAGLGGTIAAAATAPGSDSGGSGSGGGGSSGGGGGGGGGGGW